MIVNGWLDWAERKDGIADKVYSQPNTGAGLVCHSQEGWRNSIESRFFSTARDSSGQYTPYAAASTMFYNPLTGPLVQYYSVTKSTWTSGNRKANCSLWATESEGLAGTPLNANQIANMLRLASEWESHSGQVATRDPATRNVWQHNEVYDWESPNAGGTACPSNRYEPFFVALAAGGGNEVTREEYDNMVLAMYSGAEEASLPRDERLRNALWRRDEAAAGRQRSISDIARSAAQTVGQL